MMNIISNIWQKFMSIPFLLLYAIIAWVSWFDYHLITFEEMYLLGFMFILAEMEHHNRIIERSIILKKEVI